MKMKMKMKRLLLSGVVLFAGWFTLTTQAQVNIGTNEEAVSGAILQLRNKKDSVGPNASKGLAFPRVALSRVDQLYPMFLVNPNDSASGPNGDYNNPEKKNALDLKHTGLVVYNLTDKNSERLYVGLNTWNGREWVSATNPSVTPTGDAVFAPVDCEDIFTNGIDPLMKGVDATGHIALGLWVKKTGAYSLTTDTVNGYYFSAKGVALEPGELIVELTAKGRPIEAGIDYFAVGSGFAGDSLDVCLTEVRVNDPVPQASAPEASYAMGNKFPVVKGKYMPCTPLDSHTTYVELYLNVTAAGRYTFNPPSKDGISLYAAGTFSSTGPQTVRLIASGTPTKSGPVSFPISFSSIPEEGIAVVEVSIEVAAPKLTYAIIGISDIAGISTYLWSSSGRTLALNSQKNFGTQDNSAVKIAEFSRLWAAEPDNASTRLRTAMSNGNNIPDIILYNSYPKFLTDDLARTLAEYVNKGGCLIFGASDDVKTTLLKVGNFEHTVTMLNGIFGTGIELRSFKTTYTYNAPPLIGTLPLLKTVTRLGDDIYQINNNTEDPIINGPFGNLAGKPWGEDNLGNVYAIDRLQDGSIVQICSAKGKKYGGNDPNLEDNYSIVWYSQNKNIFFIGDTSGSTGGSSLIDKAASTLASAFPAKYIGGNPVTKEYGLLSNKESIYNSFLEMNAVAWAIQRALSSGINKDKRTVCP